MANQGKFALDNVTYDLITILHEKSKGLEAFNQYERDLQGNQEVLTLIQEMRQSDQQFIQRLEQHLSSRLQQNQGGRKAA